MQILEVAQGTDSVFTVTLASQTGTPLTYTTGTALSVLLWRGEDQAPISGLTAAITTAPNIVTLTIPGSSIAALDPGLYNLRIVANSTDWAAEFGLRILDAPGTGTVPPIYATRKDLVDAVPWIESAQDLQEDQAGFAEWLGKAREWADELIISRAADILYEQSLRHAPIALVDPIIPVDGVDAGPTYGRSIYPDTTIRDQLDVLREHLTENRLIVDARLRRACALWAAGRVLESKTGAQPDGTSYQILGAMYRRRAKRELRGWIARIDTNADGKAEIEIE